MDTHLSSEDFERFGRRKLSPADLLAAGRHLAACADCARRAGESVDLERRGAAILRSLEGDHPDFDALSGYVDGRAGERESIALHIGHCDECRERVATLLDARRSLRAPLWRPALAAAAILATVFVTALLLHRPRAEAPAAIEHRTTVMPAAWVSAIDEARAQRQIDPPSVLTELRPPADALRGGDATKSHVVLQPVATVVESRTPAFRWHGLEDAATVSVYRGAELIARSPQRREGSWTIDRPLTPGGTYQWQLEIGDHVFPAPPAEVARFRVLDAAAATQLGEARRLFPADHQLIGILCARAGVRDCAVRELRTHVGLHPEDAAARDLLRSVEAW